MLIGSQAKNVEWSEWIFLLPSRNSDPQTGRFIEADKLGYSTNADPTTLHKYLYANADPVNGTDPSGHDDFSVTGELGVIGISAGLGGMMSAAYDMAENGPSATGQLAAFAIGAESGAIAGFLAYELAAGMASAGLSAGMSWAITGSLFGAAGASLSAAGLNTAYEKGDTTGMWFAGGSLLLNLGLIGVSGYGVMGEFTGDAAPESVAGSRVNWSASAKQALLRRAGAAAPLTESEAAELYALDKEGISMYQLNWLVSRWIERGFTDEEAIFLAKEHVPPRR